MSSSNRHKHEAISYPINCPFCDADGKEVKLEGIDTEEAGDLYFMVCTNCGASGPSTSVFLDAGLLWNFRNGFPKEGAQ